MCIYCLWYETLLIINALAKRKAEYHIDLQSDIFITPNFGRPENKPLFRFRITSRLIQSFRQISEVCTDARTCIKQSHTKLPNRIQTLD